MTGMWSISKLEVKVAGYFTTHHQKLDELGQCFRSEPTEIELARFIDPDRNNSIKVWDNFENLSAAAAVIPSWFILGSIGMMFVLATWAKPEHGVTPLPLSIRLLGCLVLSVLLFMCCYMLNAIQKAKGIYFIYDKTRRFLELPRYNVTIVPDQIQKIFILQARGLSGWICELSVIVCLSQGGFVRYSLGIDSVPKRIYKLGKTLAEYTGSPLSALKLNRKTLKNLGLDLKTVFGKVKFIGQTEHKGIL